MFGLWTSNTPREIELGIFSILLASMPTFWSGLFEQTLPPPPPPSVMIHSADCINPVYTNLYTKVVSDL